MEKVYTDGNADLVIRLITDIKNEETPWLVINGEVVGKTKKETIVERIEDGMVVGEYVPETYYTVIFPDRTDIFLSKDELLKRYAHKANAYIATTSRTLAELLSNRYADFKHRRDYRDRWHTWGKRTQFQTDMLEMYESLLQENLL